MRSPQHSIHYILHRVTNSTNINFNNISTIKPFPFLSFLWVFFTIASIVAHCMAWVTGVSWWFLFIVVDHTDQDVSIVGMGYFDSEFVGLVMGDFLVEDEMRPILLFVYVLDF